MGGGRIEGGEVVDNLASGKGEGREHVYTWSVISAEAWYDLYLILLL